MQIPATTPTPQKRNEIIRWQVLLALYNSRGVGALEQILMSIAQTVHQDETLEELRSEFDFLTNLGLIKFYVMPTGRPDRRAYQLTPYGEDYVTGAKSIEVAIARPSPIKRAGRPAIKKEINTH